MALDPVKNLVKVTVSTGYISTDTDIVLSSGDGAKLLDPASDGAFNLVWWNSTDYSDPSDDSDAEIVRVTAKSTDTLTVTRAQEGTSASDKNISGKTYKMILGPTKKFRDDIQTQLGTKITNPMTTAGDTIYGGTSGVPTRLAKGVAGQVLTVNAGATAPEWVDASGGGPRSATKVVAASDSLDASTADYVCSGTEQSMVVEDCEDAWNEYVDGNITSSADISDKEVGSASAELVATADILSDVLMATEAISSLDLSGRKKLKFWIKSSVQIWGGDLQLLLSNQANCVSPLETIDIPDMSSNTWTQVTVLLDNSASDTSIISIGIQTGSSATYSSGFTLHIDDVELVWEDEEKIQEAIDDLSTVGGKVVLLEGTYNVLSTIDILHSNIVLAGQGNGTKLFLVNEANAAVIKIGDGSVVIGDDAVRDLQIDGNKVNQSSPNYGINIESGATNLTIINNYVHDCSYGIMVGSNENIISENRVEDNAQTGISVSYSYNNRVIGNQASSNGYAGIRLNGATKNIVSGNQANSNNQGIYLDGSQNIVSGNQINSNSYGVYINYASENTINNNRIDGNTSSGIYLYSSDYNMIIGNRITGNGAYGVDINNSSCDETLVVKNYFKANTTAAINDSGTGTIKVASTSNDNVLA